MSNIRITLVVSVHHFTCKSCGIIQSSRFVRGGHRGHVHRFGRGDVGRLKPPSCIEIHVIGINKYLYYKIDSQKH